MATDSYCPFCLESTDFLSAKTDGYVICRSCCRKMPQGYMVSAFNGEKIEDLVSKHDIQNELDKLKEDVKSMAEGIQGMLIANNSIEERDK